MISYIEGKIFFIDSELKEIGVRTDAGIGYSIKSVCLPVFTLEERVEIYVYMAVSENSVVLWGLRSLADLKVFRLLISVNGIGPTLAANILNRLSVEDLLLIVLEGQPEKLKVPGVGGKTAQKIVLELQSRINKSSDLLSIAKSSAISDSTEIEEATMALLALGYERSSVSSFMQQNTSQQTAAMLVKAYLSSLHR